CEPSPHDVGSAVAHPLGGREVCGPGVEQSDLARCESDLDLDRGLSRWHDTRWYHGACQVSTWYQVYTSRRLKKRPEHAPWYQRSSPNSSWYPAIPAARHGSPRTKRNWYQQSWGASDREARARP